MIEKLQAELLKAHDNLNEASFKINKKDFTFYYRYMTLLEKNRIEMMCIKTHIKIGFDGTKESVEEFQNHLIPTHTILEKALDKDGKRLFSHTNPKHFELISTLPSVASSSIAFYMSTDVFGTMKEVKDGE